MITISCREKLLMFLKTFNVAKSNYTIQAKDPIKTSFVSTNIVQDYFQCSLQKFPAENHY